MSEAPELAAALGAVVRRIFPRAQGIDALRRLSGGASQETWAFERIDADGSRTPGASGPRRR